MSATRERTPQMRRALGSEAGAAGAMARAERAGAGVGFGAGASTAAGISAGAGSPTAAGISAGNGLAAAESSAGAGDSVSKAAKRSGWVGRGDGWEDAPGAGLRTLRRR